MTGKNLTYQIIQQISRNDMPGGCGLKIFNQSLWPELFSEQAAPNKATKESINYKKHEKILDIFF